MTLNTSHAIPPGQSFASRAREQLERRGPELAKLRLKLAHNLHLGWREFLAKGFRFVRASAASRLRLRGITSLGVGVRVLGHSPRIENRGGTIEVGDDVVFSSPVTPISVEMKPGAVLRIGAETWINDGVWFGCTGRITIGRRVLLGPGVRIFDNSYHGLLDRRALPLPRPVTIGDDVWLASDCIVLPGVTIGRGAVIAVETVVVDDVPPFTVVAGNPAHPLRTIDPEEFERRTAARRARDAAGAPSPDVSPG